MIHSQRKNFLPKLKRATKNSKKTELEKKTRKKFGKNLHISVKNDYFRKNQKKTENYYYY